MRDGTTLRADVWRADDELRRPVLLQRLPYDKSNVEVTSVHSGLRPLTAVEAGYVVVVQDTRGRFASDGVFDPFRREAADGADTVDWASRQPWSDGNVGMFGGSYFGATQLLAAKERPPALKAIVPAITSADYYEPWTYAGGVLQLGFVLYWTLFALAPNEIARQRPPERSRYQAIFDRLFADPWATLRRLPLGDLDGLEEILPWYLEWLEHDQRDAWWDELAAHTVDVPALFIGGWYDIFVAGTIEGFRRSRGPRRLVLGPWAHANYSDTVGALQFGPTSAWAADSETLQLGFFDRHVRATTREDGPPVRFFLMGANEWLTSETWPPDGVAAERWYLRAGGMLTQEPAGVEERGDEFVYDPSDPVPTHGGATLLPGFERNYCTGPHDQREIERRPDVLSYTSAPLERPLDVVGHVGATLHVSTTAPSTDVTAKLVDVHPDGRAMLVCDGIAVHPGQTAAVEVELGPTAIRFGAGHAIRLEISSSNFPRFARNPNTGEQRSAATRFAVATQTVLHDARHSSCLRLPVRR